MKLFGIIIGLFIAWTAGAQNVEFQATAPSVVAVGEQFRLAYSINREGSNLQVPTLEGFELLMGPSTSQSSSVSVMNGRTAQSVSFTYTYILRGTREGTYQIPAATIVVDGKPYKSNSLKIQVVKDSGAAKAADGKAPEGAQEAASSSINEENLFVRVDVSRRNLYIGESLVATMKVYSRVDLANLGRSTYPAFTGFLSEEIVGPQRIELVRENYNGQIYNVGTIRKLLLYPQHTGEIVIDPFELECIVRQRLTGSRSVFDDFFQNYRDVRTMRRSRPVTITVKELPQAGKPLGFDGMVGSITMATSVSADTVNPNDAVTYKVTFRGSGNLKLLRAPSIQFPHDFEVYDPKENKEINTGENGMAGTVTFEYLAIPRYSGSYTIPAFQFSYFDPQSASYKVIHAGEYVVNVRKGAEKGQAAGNGASAVQSFKKEELRRVGEDIRYLKTEGLKLRETGVRFFGTMNYWLALIIPFVLFVIGALLNRRRIKANADLVRVKNKAATKMARKRLKVAAVAMKNHNAEPFYDEILKAMWGYVSYKLNIDRAELNRDNISDLLQRKEIDPALLQEFISVVDDCEFARYAPGNASDEQMGHVYTLGIEVITKLDKAIR